MLLWRLSSAVSFIHSQAYIKAWREPVSSLQQLDKAATTPWPSPTTGWNAGTMRVKLLKQKTQLRQLQQQQQQQQQ